MYFDLLQQYHKRSTAPGLCNPLSGFTKSVGGSGALRLRRLSLFAASRSDAAARHRNFGKIYGSECHSDLRESPVQYAEVRYGWCMSRLGCVRVLLEARIHGFGSVRFAPRDIVVMACRKWLLRYAQRGQLLDSTPHPTSQWQSSILNGRMYPILGSGNYSSTEPCHRERDPERWYPSL